MNCHFCFLHHRKNRRVHYDFGVQDLATDATDTVSSKERMVLEIIIMLFTESHLPYKEGNAANPCKVLQGCMVVTIQDYWTPSKGKC